MLNWLQRDSSSIMALSSNTIIIIIIIIITIKIRLLFIFICYLFVRPKLKPGLWKPNVPDSPTNATARPSTTLKMVSPLSSYFFFFFFFSAYCVATSALDGWFDIRLSCSVIMSDPLLLQSNPPPPPPPILPPVLPPPFSLSDLSHLFFLIFLAILFCREKKKEKKLKREMVEERRGMGYRDRVSIGMQSIESDRLGFSR